MEAAMPVEIKVSSGATMLAEMQEFGTFGFESQRYICRSLDMALYPDAAPGDWARSEREVDDIRAQKRVYELLAGIRSAVPDSDGPVDPEAFILPLIAVTTFDVTCGPIASFAEYRFLYERLLGSRARPWLVSAFLAAASAPHLPAEIREILIRSTNAAITDRWSTDEPVFRPYWLGEHELLAA
jgi:hypothetical protein